MVQITTSRAQQVIDMSDPGLVGFGGGISADGNSFSWSSASTQFADVDINGENLTYSGSGAATELSGGTISSIAIDVANDDSLQQGELFITGTEGLTASKIDKDRPRSFWNEVLKGNDTFDLSGIVQSGAAANVIFGDDLAAATAALAGITDAGGDDTILGGNARSTLIGDAYRVAGDVAGGFTLRAKYDAGDDSITGAASTLRVDLIGDALDVDDLATLNGGDDILDNQLNTADGSLIAGDAQDQLGGTVKGGVDTITTGEAALLEAAGDVFSMYGGSLYGGDDIIAVRSTDQGVSYAGGDVYTLATFVDDGITIVGGDDSLTGADGRDRLAGDIYYATADNAHVTGGNDTLIGGAGNDVLYGEVLSGFAGQISGGDDWIDGGAGEDEIAGQTGNDTLRGGSGADSLDGGSGVNTLSYTGSNAGVTVSTGNNTATGGHATGDVLSGSFRKVIGSSYGDTVTGGGGDNTFSGGGGNDTLRGNGGADTLSGGAGMDTLIGGAHADTLIGGAGLDTFVFQNGSGFDTVQLFQNGADTFDLSGVSGVDGLSDISRTQTSNGVVVDFGPGSFLIEGANLAQIGASDFDF